VAKREKSKIQKIPLDMSKASPPLYIRNAIEETRLKISGSPDLSVFPRVRESEKERARAKESEKEREKERERKRAKQCVRESERERE